MVSFIFLFKLSDMLSHTTMWECIKTGKQKDGLLVPKKQVNNSTSLFQVVLIKKLSLLSTGWQAGNILMAAMTSDTNMIITSLLLTIAEISDYKRVHSKI